MTTIADQGLIHPADAKSSTFGKVAHVCKILPADFPKALQPLLATAAKHERKLYASIVEGRRPQYSQMRYVASLDPLTVAACRAWQSFRLYRRPPASAIMETAKSLSALHGSDEPVIVRIKRKGLTGYRLVCAFGMRNKCLQYLVGEALRARSAFHPCQFANSKGRPAAVLAVRDALLAGNVYVAEVDIKNCYGSFNGEELANVLPLPRRLIETAVLAKNYNLQIQPISQKEVNRLKHLRDMQSDEAEEHWEDEFDLDLGHPLLDLHAHNLPLDFFVEEARRGIPMGSALSALVCEVLLSPAVAHAANYGPVSNYADNVSLLASTKADLASRIETLRCSLEELPGGPLPVNMPVIYEPGEPFTFLGYTLTLKNGHVIIEPSDKNLTKFEREFRRRWKRALKASGQDRSQRIASLCGYVRSWVGSFSLWSGATAHRHQYLATIKQLAGEKKKPILPAMGSHLAH